MARYLLGIDNGSTVCKASLFDLNGQALYSASRRLPVKQTQPGWMERDLGVVWQETAATIREVVAQVDAAEIGGVGSTGHGNGLYLLDADGQPLRPGILSLDTRAAGLVTDWMQAHHAEVVAHIRQQFYAGQTGPLLAWLKQHEPDTYARIGAVLLCKDYINFCLTGQQATDYTDMSATALLNIPALAYDAALLQRYGLPEIRAALPPLAHSAAVIGTVTDAAAAKTGLAPGTPVVAGMIDMHASAIGAGVVDVPQACIVAGSWSINEVVAAEPPATTDIFLVAPFAVPGRWLVAEASATSAANLDWFVREFCAEEQRTADARGVSVFDVCGEAIAAIPATADLPVFHPYLYGANVQATARAGFYGVTGWHTRAHLLRALYEGIVFGHRQHIDILRRAGVHFDRARLTGGGARSAIWSQMFADVLGVVVEVPDSTETGTRGAALAAGVGAGLYADFAAAAQQGVTVMRTHQPDPALAAIYEARYTLYTRLQTAMAAAWHNFDHLRQPSKETAR